MNKFAKLFEFADIGQVLVLIDQGETGPEVRFSFTASGLGVCTVKFNFADTEEGWDKAELLFEQADEAHSHQLLKPEIERLINAFSAEEEAV